MVRITFKNVGQGDSILIEWKDNGEDKIGIIDCNKFNGSNPVLDYLKGKGTKQIDFIILSHPHFDHFSGLGELFNWCLSNEIKLNSFLITSHITPDYITTALETATARSEIAQIFQLARKLRNREGTQIFTIDDNPNCIKKIGDWDLLFLSPSSIETDYYQKDIKAFSREEEFHNHPNGNWLSTLIKLSKSEQCVLLTSDIESSTLTRVKRQKRITEKIILAQAPHHGSKKNHNSTFWCLNSRAPQAPIVISVGENKYGHPSKHVLNDFEGLQFSIERTDQSKANDNKKEDYQDIIHALDFVSELIEDESRSSYGNDLVFNF
ncbi:MAG: MBL fold metallo-hydrolase [bacterium]